MAGTRRLLEDRLRVAFATVSPGADPVLRESDRADFQANGVLALAKKLGRPPRRMAEEILAAVRLDDVCDAVEVSGPGFLNLTLSTEYLSGQVAALLADPRLGVESTDEPRRVVVDYSAPNVAKEMHVGHLRTTIIGDALVRLLDFEGHDVVRENHIGDWGTPFGMLIEHLVDVGEEKAVHELSLGELGEFYRRARQSFDSDERFAERSRRRVVLLQEGEPETVRLWRVLVSESVRYFDDVYGKLGVLLADEDIVGESFYNPMLPDVVTDLERLGLLVEHEGARCVFPPGFTNREGDPLPLIVQKSDGGFGYAATDLAAIRDRVDRLGVSLLLYVVGAPQAQHFAMVFAVARMAGWLPEGTEAVHVAFGNVLGADHKLLRSRSGDNVKLVELLDEAVERGRTAVASRDPSLDERELNVLGNQLGIGAVKYADLSTERHRDYVFDWDRMLAFEGNTGPYLQYAHARICSIFRRAERDLDATAGGAAPPRLEVPEERELARRLTSFDEAVGTAVETQSPSRLTGYLYELATVFTTFYEQCPVLRAPDDATRESRLALCAGTARVLACGLGLLGIAAPEHM
jgi:arginyl-tRNA synthetase